MLACSERILRSTEGRTFEEFRADPVSMDAVFYNITIIGEAARHVPHDVAARHPQIEWEAIRGMRDNLIQGSLGSDLEIICATIQRDIPDLAGKLRHVLEREGA
jgi:uncharacterized protein with HEPN domain